VLLYGETNAEQSAARYHECLPKRLRVPLRPRNRLHRGASAAYGAAMIVLPCRADHRRGAVGAVCC